jgi:hypothetical protein
MADRIQWAAYAAAKCWLCLGSGETHEGAICSCIDDATAAQVQRDCARKNASRQIQSDRHSGGLPGAETNSGVLPVSRREPSC